MKRLFLAVALAAAACGGGSSSPAAPSTTTTTTTPPATSSTAPVITSMTPSFMTSGAPTQLIVLTGSNFATGLTLSATRSDGSAITGPGNILGAVTPTTVTARVSIGPAGTYTFQITAANGEKSNAFTKTVDTATTWSAEGVRLSESTGVSGLVNITGWQMSDGRWRYLVSRNGGYETAISNDGVSLTLERTGSRYSPGNCGHSRALKLADGRVRAYCRDNVGLLSYISSDDGLTFSREGSGYFITNAQIGASRLTMGGVVPTRDGRWRMYFADEIPDGEQVNNPPMKVMSAISSDLLNWTVEPGVRIGANTTQSGSATHPSAIVNADGSVSVAYNQFAWTASPQTTGIWVATSTDGLSFTRDERVSIDGADPDIHIVNGVTRFFYTACLGPSLTDNPVCSARLSGTLRPASVPIAGVPLDGTFRPIR